mmetsp:Transcript_31973/g.77890  ORF Transcript_31973/g.77890 Transcript_31973/m.77890 type:complete len:430 (-) Transcript_31973:121-1410(-)
MLAVRHQPSNLTLTGHCGAKRARPNTKSVEEDQKGVSVQTWPCARCTFQNQAEYIFCGMCGSPKEFGQQNSFENGGSPKKARRSTPKKPICPPQGEPSERLFPLAEKASIPKSFEMKEKFVSRCQAEIGATRRIAQSSGRLASIASHISADAALIDYETIKDKENPKQLHYGFGPKAQSQWHWFFVAKKTMTPTETDKNAYEFTLELDKFGLAQGKAKRLGSNSEETLQSKEDMKDLKFTYGCTGAKLQKTASRKKKSILQAFLNDDPVSRDERLARAQAHKAALKYQKGRTKVFIDKHGKRNPYFGMPIGGVHHWLYQDAVLKETGLKSGRSILWQTKNVQWKETKVTKNRWLLQVRGTLIAPKGSIPSGVKLEKQESILIADQIATKISPTSYHVHLKGVSLPITGATAYQRNCTTKQILEKVMDKV